MPRFDVSTRAGLDRALDHARSELSEAQYREALGYYLALAAFEAGDRAERPSATAPPTDAAGGDR
jgi:hypothetical protein